MKVNNPQSKKNDNKIIKIYDQVFETIILIMEEKPNFIIPNYWYYIAILINTFQKNGYTFNTNQNKEITQQNLYVIAKINEFSTVSYLISELKNDALTLFTFFLFNSILFSIYFYIFILTYLRSKKFYDTKFKKTAERINKLLHIFLSFYQWLLIVPLLEINVGVICCNKNSFVAQYQNCSQPIFIIIIASVSIILTLSLNFLIIYFTRSYEFQDTNQLRRKFSNLVFLIFVIQFTVIFIDIQYDQYDYFKYYIFQTQNIFTLYDILVNNPFRNRILSALYNLQFSYCLSTSLLLQIWLNTNLIQQIDIFYCWLPLNSLTYYFVRSIQNKKHETLTRISPLNFQSYYKDFDFYLDELYTSALNYTKNEGSKVQFCELIEYHKNNCSNLHCRCRSYQFDENYFKNHLNQTLDLIEDLFIWSLKQPQVVQDSQVFMTICIKYISFISKSRNNFIKAFFYLQQYFCQLKNINYYNQKIFIVLSKSMQYFNEIEILKFNQKKQYQQQELSAIDLTNSEEFKSEIIPLITNYLIRKRELFVKLQAGYENFSSLSRDAKELSLYGMSVVEQFQKKMQEYSFDESNLCIPKKVCSLFQIFIQNNLRKATDLEYEIKQNLKKELSQKQDKFSNLNCIKGKSQIFQVSLSNNIGKINKKNLNSSQIFRLSLFFGYSVQEFRKIDYITDLIPPYIQEFHTKLVEQVIEQGNIGSIFSPKNVFVKTKENFLFPVKLKLQSCPNIINSFEMIVSVLKLQSQQQFLTFNETGQILGITEKLFKNLFKNPIQKQTKKASLTKQTEANQKIKQKLQVPQDNKEQEFDVFKVYNCFNIYLIFQNLLELIQSKIDQQSDQKTDNNELQEYQLNNSNRSSSQKQTYKIQKNICSNKFFSIRLPSQLQELSKKFTSQVSQKGSSANFDQKQFYRNSIQFLKEYSSSFEEKKSLQNFEAVISVVNNKICYHQNSQLIEKQYFIMQVHEYRIQKKISEKKEIGSNFVSNYINSSFQSQLQLVNSLQAAQLSSFEASSTQLYSPKFQQIQSKDTQFYESSQIQTTQQSNTQMSHTSSSSSSSQSSQTSTQLKNNKNAIETQIDNSPLTIKNKQKMNQEASQLNQVCQNFTNAFNSQSSNEKDQVISVTQTTNQDKIAITTVSFQEEPRNPSKSLSSMGTNGRRLSKFGEAAYFKSIDAFQKYNHSLSNINQDLEKDLQNFNQITPLNSSKNNLLYTERNSIKISNSSSNLFSNILNQMQVHGQQSKGQFLDVYDNKNKQDDSDTASQKRKKVKAKIRSSFRRAILANKQKNQNKELDFFDLNPKQNEQELEDEGYQKQNQAPLFVDENDVKLNEENEQQHHSQSSEKKPSKQKSKANAKTGENQKDEEDERSNDQNIVKQDNELVQKYINCSSSSIYNSSTLMLHVKIFVFIGLCTGYLLQVLNFTSSVKSIVDQKNVVLDTSTLYSKQLSELLISYFLEDIQIYDNFSSYSSYLPQLALRCQQNTQLYKDQYSDLINYFSQLEGSNLSQTINIPTFSKGQLNLSQQTNADLILMTSYYILNVCNLITNNALNGQSFSDGYYFLLKNYNQTLILSQALYSNITTNLSDHISALINFFIIMSIVASSIFTLLNLVSLKKLRDLIQFKRRILLLISRISLDELDVEIIKIESSMKQLMDQMDLWISFDFVKLITNTKKSNESKHQHSKFYNQKGAKRKEIQASSLIFDQKISKKIYFITYIIIAITSIAFYCGFILKNYYEITRMQRLFNSIKSTDQALSTFTQILTYSNILYSQEYFSQHKDNYPNLDITDVYNQYNSNINNLKEFNNWISQQQFSDDIQGSSQQQNIQYIMKSNLCDQNSPVYQNCSDISSNITSFYYQGLQGMFTQYFVYLQTYDQFLQNQFTSTSKQKDLLYSFYNQQSYEILYINGFVMPLIAFNELKNLFGSFLISETSQVQQSCLLYFIIGGTCLVIIFYIILIKLYKYTKTEVQALKFSLTLIPYYKFQDEATIYILKQLFKI
ncbi:hypothetical protein ABPG74_004322 [Tetrahymena malaccensis]